MIELYRNGEKRVQVVEEARRWEQAGIVSPAQATVVSERYRPELVQVNLFIRILLALFTALGLAALAALLAVILDVEELGLAIFFLLFAPACTMIADRTLIHGRRLYRCGAEEVLLGCAVGFLALAVGIFGHELGRTTEQFGWLLAHVVVLAGATALAVRYGYALAALAAVATLAALPFHLADALPWYGQAWSRAILFLLLATTGIWAQWQRARRDDLPRGYRWCLEVVRLGALTGIYLDVNLYAHRLLWRQLLGESPGTGSVPWTDPLCAALTALLPLAALLLGLLRRDRALLWYAVLTAIASILTLKYYIHFGHLAEELTAAGLLLAGLAFFLLRWLHNGKDRRRGAFTAEPLLEPRLYGLDAEALAALQPVAPTPREAAPAGFTPGGGSFGGGGSSGGY
ncbi:hypothetical protein JCM30471_09390 [Desulfuromonas carbonis]|uniref:hypothetical protein n=1 Tax=Desulfuromonas sp. DDH964 TaxID=1823759 RepID=UPI00078BEC5A|nr:hypothetical protein [Desulfuromonas sp. DDH964]AMV72424.1 hypothetical protein DBW_2082 [Desulfuromonas sp. DDH964]